jgi:hypothetical protein
MTSSVSSVRSAVALLSQINGVVRATASKSATAYSLQNIRQMAATGKDASGTPRLIRLSSVDLEGNSREFAAGNDVGLEQRRDSLERRAQVRMQRLEHPRAPAADTATNASQEMKVQKATVLAEDWYKARSTLPADMQLRCFSEGLLNNLAALDTHGEGGADKSQSCPASLSGLPAQRNEPRESWLHDQYLAGRSAPNLEPESDVYEAARASVSPASSDPQGEPSAARSLDEPPAPAEPASATSGSQSCCGPGSTIAAALRRIFVRPAPTPMEKLRAATSELADIQLRHSMTDRGARACALYQETNAILDKDGPEVAYAYVNEHMAGVRKASTATLRLDQMYGTKSSESLSSAGSSITSATRGIFPSPERTPGEKLAKLMDELSRTYLHYSNLVRGEQAKKLLDEIRDISREDGELAACTHAEKNIKRVRKAPAIIPESFYAKYGPSVGRSRRPS